MRLDWTLGLQRDATKLGRDYWLAKRGERRMPLRSDLEPAGMRKFTTHVGLVEVRRKPPHEVDYFIRRAGGSWEEVLGHVTGKLIQEFLPPEIQRKWRLVFHSVLERKAPVAVKSTVAFEGKDWLDAELLVAPLGDGDVSMFFLVFDSWTRRRAPVQALPPENQSAIRSNWIARRPPSSTGA